VHLSSVKFPAHFILEEGPHVACPPFFFFSFTVNVRHICLIFVISFSHSNLSFFLYPAFPSISFSTFHFRHFIFTFKYFIFLFFSLAHQSYTSPRTSHSFSFNSFIQPHSNTLFISIHLVHSFFIRTTSFVVAPHLVGDSFPVVRDASQTIQTVWHATPS
jgi:hypothetical protein